MVLVGVRYIRGLQRIVGSQDLGVCQVWRVENPGICTSFTTKDWPSRGQLHMGRVIIIINKVSFDCAIFARKQLWCNDDAKERRTSPDSSFKSDLQTSQKQFLFFCTSGSLIWFFFWWDWMLLFRQENLWTMLKPTRPKQESWICWLMDIMLSIERSWLCSW
jgi:hypothetical protein